MAERRPVIAGNWKMFKTVSEATDYTAAFLKEVKDISDCDVVLCGPFTTLYPLKGELEKSGVRLGAQNMSWEEEGAFTGEISARMLLDMGCAYVIIGHSERREIFGETDEGVNKKVRKALAAGLIPILCVGENLKIREEGKEVDWVRTQVIADLAGLAKEDLSRIVIAYEPIWAIGTGKTASSRDAQEMCLAIRNELKGLMAAEAENVAILYGGSVKLENIEELMAEPDVDGALVGGASLDPVGFAAIVQRGAAVLARG